MEKIKLDRNVFIPMPVCLVGCLFQDRANFMAAGWVSRVNADPPQIGIGISRAHATAEGIAEHRAFSVCFPGRSLADKTDYCGLFSGKKVDKSKVFELFFGELKSAPLIAEAPLNLECSLVQTIEAPTNFFFIGEIRAAYAGSKFLQNGKLDPKKADYLFLTMPDNTYWTLGDPVGKAWSIGKRLKR